jgi:hypothetical protein
MNLFSSDKEDLPVQQTKKPSTFKIFIGTVGALFAVSHIGLVGYLIRQPYQIPSINIPKGDYSSYELNAGPDGYSIKYKANDPAILNSEKSLELLRTKKGLFGPNAERRSEYSRQQYTMDGVRNIGGAIDGEGKSLAKSEECIRADAGARSQGAMAGSAIAAGVAVPALSGIPYIGWLAGGWALLLGQQVGSEIGSEIGSEFNDC